jgi:hypothetical protein
MQYVLQWREEFFLLTHDPRVTDENEWVLSSSVSGLHVVDFGVGSYFDSSHEDFARNVRISTLERSDNLETRIIVRMNAEQKFKQWVT